MYPEHADNQLGLCSSAHEQDFYMHEHLIISNLIFGCLNI